MLKHTAQHKRVRVVDGGEAPLPFATVLMDARYATMPLWKRIEALGKTYYGPVRANRQVSLGPGQPYQRVDALDGCDGGLLVHLNSSTSEGCRRGIGSSCSGWRSRPSARKGGAASPTP